MTNPKVEGPLKLLFVAHFEPGFGGIQRYGQELAEGLQNRGHRVDWVNCNPSLRQTNSRLSDYLPSLETLDRFYYGCRYCVSDYRFHNAVRRLCRQKIAEVKPDIVHFLHVYLPTGISLTKRSVVSCYGLEVANIPPVRASLRRATGIHSISDFTAELIRQEFGDSDAVRVLRWGIRTAVIQEPAPVPEYDLITVGRIVRRKNLDTVLKALAGLPHVLYAVVGDGPEVPALKSLANDLGLKNVTFLGPLSDHHRDQTMAKSRAFIMCPRDRPGDVEGLGLVYYEAFGHGLPVIGSSNGGAPEAIRDCGVVVRNAEDVNELRQAITTLFDQAEYERARRAVLLRQKSDSWDKFLAEMEQWYRSIIDGYKN